MTLVSKPTSLRSFKRKWFLVGDDKNGGSLRTNVNINKHFTCPTFRLSTPTDKQQRLISKSDGSQGVRAVSPTLMSPLRTARGFCSAGKCVTGSLSRSARNRRPSTLNIILQIIICLFVPLLKWNRNIFTIAHSYASINHFKLANLKQKLHVWSKVWIVSAGFVISLTCFIHPPSQ